MISDSPSTRGMLSSAERDSDGDPLFRQLLEGAPDAMIVVGSDGRIVFSNECAERMFQYERHALLGAAIETLIPERLRLAHQGQRERYMAAPRARPMGSGLELIARRCDGSEFLVEISLSPVSTSNGRLIAASVRDISERKVAEVAMRRLQAQLLSAVESIHAAFAIFDPGDHLVLCNSEYRRLVAAQLSGDVRGRTFQEILVALADFLSPMEQGPGLVAWRWSQYHREPNGALDLCTRSGQHLRVVERRTAEGGTVMTISDITQDARHREELRHARAVAEAASSAKSDFLASMSHELRTPLNAILGFAQLMQRDRKSPLSERQLERVRHVLRGGEHLLRLIDDVLDLSRIETGRTSVSPERLDVREVLAEVQATLVPLAARAQVQISVEPTPREAAWVVADRTRLKQILMNFGSNAVKYGRWRGTVHFRARANDGRTRMEVSDNGLGISRDKQSLLFQPFQRAGQETGPIEGTGIGLAISERLAKLMGGGVGFESVEGQGSTFWIELSCPPPDEHPAGTAGTPPGASVGESNGHSRRWVVLYVEDNASNIAFMRDIMTDLERIELITAPTAELGIELARAHLPDVIIMDIHLPGMSGIEACHQLRRWPETRDTPIIALSAAALIHDAEPLASAGFDRYLSKPVRVDELIAALEALVR